MAVAQRQRKEKPHRNRAKGGLRTRVRISGEANSPPDKPNLHKGRRKKHKNKSQNSASGLSSFHIFFKDIFSFACQIKLSYNTEL